MRGRWRGALQGSKKFLREGTSNSLTARAPPDECLQGRPHDRAVKTAARVAYSQSYEMRCELQAHPFTLCGPSLNPPTPHPDRLKKLNRMMTSSLAQKDAERYRRHTYLLTALVTVAHVVCFVVLITQINARYE